MMCGDNAWQEFGSTYWSLCVMKGSLSARWENVAQVSPGPYDQSGVHRVWLLASDLMVSAEYCGSCYWEM